jgi:hypothetical protein
MLEHRFSGLMLGKSLFESMLLTKSKDSGGNVHSDTFVRKKVKQETWPPSRFKVFGAVFG